MKWEITFERGAFNELHRRQNDLPAKAHFIMYDSLESGLIKKILNDLKGQPQPHEIWIYNPNWNITVASSVNYKSKEIAIYDVLKGDQRDS